MKIHFTSAPCGSGKTHNMIGRGARLARLGQRVIIAQPTRELIDKTVEEQLKARPSPPPYKVFHGGTVGEGSVAKALLDFLKDPPDGGCIIFVTHALLPLVRFWPNQEDWHLIIDEELQILRYQAHQLPHNHQLVTECIDVEPVNATYGRVVVLNDDGLEEMGRNKDRDDIYEVVAETIRTLINKHWETCVNLEQYQKLLSGKVKRLAFHSVLNPSVVNGFRSVFMACANFEDVAVYRLWSDRGVKFKENRAFAKDLRFTTHQNGPLLTICHGTDHAWSKKRLQASAGPDGVTTFDAMVNGAKDLFGDGSFLWLANKSCHDNPFPQNAIRMPSKPHGLNSFLHINDMVFLSALNPTTDHFRFLETQGLTGSEVRRAIYHSAAYQSVMRTSLRDPENQEPKRILVPDRGLAEYLHGLFPGSRIEKLDIGLSEEVARKTVVPGSTSRRESGRRHIVRELRRRRLAS